MLAAVTSPFAFQIFAAHCYDNAVAESFFGLLKRERVNRTRYRTRDEARADVFDYIEVFYNRKRRHGYLGNISPADFEERSAGGLPWERWTPSGLILRPAHRPRD